MNAPIAHHHLSQPDTESMLVWRDMALCQQRSVARTLQSLFREGLLNTKLLIHDHHVSWFPLWGKQCLIRIEGLQPRRTQAWQLDGAITLYHHGMSNQVIRSGSELLRAVAESLSIPLSETDMTRLMDELENSLHNDVHCQTFRRHWGAQLREQYSSYASTFLESVYRANVPHASLLLEQWGAIGHPSHPTFKTKSDLSDEEVRNFSPEFHPVISIPVIAIRTDCLCISGKMSLEDYRQWMVHYYPQAMQDWDRAMLSRHQLQQDWLPLPVHPYQLKKIIPDQFSEEIAAEQILLLDDVYLKAGPTMSFRTLCPLIDSAPHIKLPIGVRLTSVQRTVSPKSIEMGPRISHLLTSILEKENYFQGTLSIAAERCGAYFKTQDDDKARHLSVLFRDNPAQLIRGNQFTLPVGSLFADSPFDGRSLVCELITLGYGDTPHPALAFFEQYARVVLSACLSSYLIYGIAFEAHQQNSYMQLDAKFRPTTITVRDFGDWRVYLPILNTHNLNLVPARAGHSVFYDIAPVRDKLLHATFICQLSEMVLLLSRHYALPELLFWRTFRDCVNEVFEAVKPRTPIDFWEAERKAILHAPWPVKSFLRMRFSDSSTDIHEKMSNPLVA